SRDSIAADADFNSSLTRASRPGLSTDEASCSSAVSRSPRAKISVKSPCDQSSTRNAASAIIDRQRLISCRSSEARARKRNRQIKRKTKTKPLRFARPKGRRLAALELVIVPIDSIRISRDDPPSSNNAQTGLSFLNLQAGATTRRSRTPTPNRNRLDHAGLIARLCSGFVQMISSAANHRLPVTRCRTFSMLKKSLAKLLGLALTAILCLPLAACGGWQSALNAHGPEAERLAKLFWFFTSVCGVVLLVGIFSPGLGLV